MDYSLSVYECPDGTAIIRSPSGGVMASFDSWAIAEAYWNLIGAGAP